MNNKEAIELVSKMCIKVMLEGVAAQVATLSKMVQGDLTQIQGQITINEVEYIITISPMSENE